MTEQNNSHAKADLQRQPGDSRTVEPGLSDASQTAEQAGMPQSVPCLQLGMGRIRAMSALQLYNLHQALQTTDEVVFGLCNSGRFSDAKGGVFNDAGEIMGELQDYLCNALAAVKSEASRRSEGKVRKADACWLGFIQISYEARFHEHLSGVALVVAQALVVEENAHG